MRNKKTFKVPTRFLGVHQSKRKSKISDVPGKHLSQDRSGSWIPYGCIFVKRRSCGTESNAFERASEVAGSRFSSSNCSRLKVVWLKMWECLLGWLYYWCIKTLLLSGAFVCFVLFWFGWLLLLLLLFFVFVFHLEFLVLFCLSQTTLPTNRTTYYYRVFEFPKLQKRHDIIQVWR